MEGEGPAKLAQLPSPGQPDLLRQPVVGRGGLGHPHVDPPAALLADDVEGAADQRLADPVARHAVVGVDDVLQGPRRRMGRLVVAGAGGASSRVSWA